MIELSDRDGIAVVQMKHGKANALDFEFCGAVAAQFEVLRDAESRAVVLTGQGTMFSAGVDLLRLNSGGADYVRRFLPVLHRLFHTVFFFPKPVVAAVNGHAIAGGCVLQACADRRIAAGGNNARIGVTELLVGVPFPALAFEVMRFATPPAFFAELMLSGATFSPEAAQARRMVDEVSEPAALLDRAVAAARTLAALSPAAFAQTKMQLRQPAIDALERHGTRIDAEVEQVWTAAGTHAYIRDYVARTFKKS